MEFNPETYKPLWNGVLLEVKTKERSQGGILLAEEKEEKFLKVVSVGSDCKYVKPGDIVLLGPTSVAIELLYKRKIYRQVPEMVIAGIVPG